MDKVNALGAGIALAVTLALVSALCAVAFVLAPDATLDFLSAFMHGLDLKSVKSAAPLSFGRVLYRPVHHRLHRWVRVRLDVQHH